MAQRLGTSSPRDSAGAPAPVGLQRSEATPRGQDVANQISIQDAREQAHPAAANENMSVARNRSACASVRPITLGASASRQDCPRLSVLAAWLGSLLPKHTTREREAARPRASVGVLSVAQLARQLDNRAFLRGNSARAQGGRQPYVRPALLEVDYHALDPVVHAPSTLPSANCGVWQRRERG